MEVEAISNDGEARGAAPAIVEQFVIEGLHGYRTVSLSSSHAATVLIARNGSGKTTLLGALDAFLRGQLLRLSGLRFSVIRCKLRGLNEPLELRYEDVQALAEIPDDPSFRHELRRHGVAPNALVDFVLHDYRPLRDNFSELHDNEIFNKLAASFQYRSHEVKKYLDRLYEMLLSGRNANVDKVMAGIKQVVGDTEIVYLPTYRRIELPLSDDAKDERPGGRRKPSIRAKLGISRKVLFGSDIQFGLSDISERLRELNNEVLFNSNQGYREISANIINEMLDGTFERDMPGQSELPDRETLLLFFSRLREGRRSARFSDLSIPNIDRIYREGAIPYESNKFLQYFLGKLNTVIEATRGIEGIVERFIEQCNVYLSDRVGTEEYDCDNTDHIGDGKTLRLDRKDLTVVVESDATKRKIPLDSLSSGEKQVISLFARLYLYSGPKIILIDEPELSLSMDWQRKILPDIINAPTCTQVIAITHSPFVFDNELEPFARALVVKVDPTSTQNSDLDSEEEGDE
jgi:predicted ATPase